MAVEENYFEDFIDLSHYLLERVTQEPSGKATRRDIICASKNFASILTYSLDLENNSLNTREAGKTSKLVQKVGEIWHSDNGLPLDKNVVKAEFYRLSSDLNENTRESVKDRFENEWSTEGKYFMSSN